MILQARDRGLFTAITDCGAGGLSSAVGEMGEKLGADGRPRQGAAEVRRPALRRDLDQRGPGAHGAGRAAGEGAGTAQARRRARTSRRPSSARSARDNAELILNYQGTEVGRLSMDFLHNGIPMPTRKAVVIEKSHEAARPAAEDSTGNWPAFANATSPRDSCSSALSHPNIASKHWIIRQYDHEVQGGSVDQAAGRPAPGRPVRCRGHPPEARQPQGRRHRLRHGPAHRRSLRHGASPPSTRPSATSSPSAPTRPQIAILDNFCWPSVR